MPLSRNNLSGVSPDNINVSNDLIPAVTDTYDIGSSSKVWANVYATALNGSLYSTTAITDTKKITLSNPLSATYDYRSIGTNTNVIDYHCGSNSSSSGHEFYTSNLAMNIRNLTFKIPIHTTGYGFQTAYAGQITNNTAATSATTGALQVTGGIGVGGNSFINAQLTVTDLSKFLGAADSGAAMNVKSRNNRYMDFQNSSGTAQWALREGSSNQDLSFSDQVTPTSNVIYLKRGGNVGIKNNNPSTALDVTGTINTSVGITLPTSGGTASTLNFYEESYSHTVNFSGPWVATQYTIKLTRTGNMVTAHIPEMQNASTATLVITMATVFPARFRPTTSYVCISLALLDNSAEKTGVMTIGTGGSLSIGVNAAGSAFSGTGGTTGNYATDVSWLV